MRQPGRRRGAWWLAACGLICGLALGEWVVAPWFLPPVGYYIKTPGQLWISEMGDGVMPGVHGPARMQFTADGLRADPFDEQDRYRILCIGGSTTECAALDTNETWPHLLQDRLRAASPALHTWVGNGGGSGLNTRNHILIMEHVVPNLPHVDLVIHLLGINDLMHRIGADDEFVPLTPEQILVDGLSLDRAFQVHPTRERNLPAYKRTNTWRLARQVKRVLVDRQAAPGVAQVTRYAYKTQQDLLQKRRREVMTIRTVLPDLRPGLEEFERNLRYLIGQARAQHRRIVFLTQPTLWRDDLSDYERYQLCFGQVGRDALNATEYYAPEALAAGIAQYNAVTRRVCAEERVECLDLASLIPKNLDSFYDDCHFNEPGAVKVADAVSRYLVAHPPFAASAASVASNGTVSRGSGPAVTR